MRVARDEGPYVVGLIDLDGIEGPRLVANLGGQRANSSSRRS